MRVAYTRISLNRKTGPIPVSVTEENSCPDTCSLKGNGCYAEYGPLGMKWRSIEKNGMVGSRKQANVMPWEQFCREISVLPRNQLWRHNAAGDLPGHRDRIDIEKLDELVKANSRARARGFTYTHKPVGFEGTPLINATAILAANANGFVVNLSADNLRDADRLAALGIAPVVTVLPENAPNKMRTPEGRSVIVCPAETGKITCDRCQLCAKTRKAIIGFRAHGPGKKKLPVIN